MAVSKNNRIQASVLVSLVLVFVFIFLVNLGATIMLFVELPEFADILLLRN